MHTFATKKQVLPSGECQEHIELKQMIVGYKWVAGMEMNTKKE